MGFIVCLVGNCPTPYKNRLAVVRCQAGIPKINSSHFCGTLRYLKNTISIFFAVLCGTLRYLAMDKRPKKILTCDELVFF